MFGSRKLEDFSIEELEKALLIKRRQTRLDRFQRLSGEGRSVNQALIGADNLPQESTPLFPQENEPSLSAIGFQVAAAQPLGWGMIKQKFVNHKFQAGSRPKKVMDTFLLGLEVVALFGLITVLVVSFLNLKELNNEVASAQKSVVKQQIAPTPTPTPPIAVARLPGGHSPPTSPEGAVPDVPPHLQQWVQPALSPSSAAIKVERSPSLATRITIPKIKVDAPIVQGITWEDLKQGVGHLPGSANPGERGNLYLAAHNDIYGEIFRYLEEMEPGDQFFIYSGEEKFRYVVKEKRIIKPTEVEVMLPTTEPVATLQTCHPYLVDTHRLVVIGELAE